MIYDSEASGDLVLIQTSLLLLRSGQRGGLTVVCPQALNFIASSLKTLRASRPLA